MRRFYGGACHEYFPSVWQTGYVALFPLNNSFTLPNPMTHASTTPPTAPTRLPLPQDQVIYLPLSTDFYPWTEVLTDIERRQEPSFTAVLDIQEENRWARFVWVRGALRGGVAASGQDVPLDVAVRALPNAHVALTGLEPAVAEVVWNCRAAPAKALAQAWPAPLEQLERERFTGALLAGDDCSYWEAGTVLSGVLPAAGVVCLAVAPDDGAERASLVHFWRELIAVTQRSQPDFSGVWRQVSMQLSDRYVVLDPFAHEINVEEGRLSVDDDVTLDELRPAMLTAYRASLRRLNVRLQDLPITTLSQREAWIASGLEAP